MNIETLNRIEAAKAVTSALLTRTSEVAVYIEAAMVALGVGALLGGKYTVRTLRGSAAFDRSIYMSDGQNSVRMSCTKLSAERETYYLSGDFSCPYQRPNRADILEFIADIPAILAELAGYSEPTNVPAVTA